MIAKFGIQPLNVKTKVRNSALSDSINISSFKGESNERYLIHFSRPRQTWRVKIHCSPKS